MSNIVKRILTLVLCFAMVLTMVPAVFAAEPKFDLSGSTMTLGNTLEINFVIDTANLEGADNYAVIAKQYADERGTVTKTVPQSEWKVLDGTKYYVSYAVSAKEMNDTLTTVVYNAAGEAVSNEYIDSVAGYCVRMLGKEEQKEAPSAEKMSLFVDMVNYGAAAQTEWSYNVENLANAGLTEAQQAYATEAGEIANILEKGAGYVGSSLSLKENILLNIVYNANEVAEAAYAQVSFVDHYGNDESVTIPAESFKYMRGGSMMYVEITAMAVADYNQAVTVELYNEADEVISTTVDSMGSYISRQDGALYNAIAAFGASAYNYFHNEDAPGLGENIIEISANVSVENGQVSENASIGEEGVNAQIPAGVQVESNTLTLTITEKESSDSGVALEAGQEILPLDIHMEGISAENTTPIQVFLGKILPNGLNIGNITLYHVENGVSTAMTRVMTLAELDEHNEFYYDPATGDITVAMASFSEVAMVAEPQKPWEGEIAKEFAGGDGSEGNPWIIANADQLAYMSQAVSNNKAYADDYYKLISDVNLSGEEAQKNDKKNLIFYPIGYWAKKEGTNSAGETYYGAGNTFTGTFDGNGNTIGNIYQNTWLMDGDYDAGYWDTAMGLFGALYNATIKNLTVDNFQSDGEYTPTGCIAAYAGGPVMLFENIYLTNCNPRVYNTGNGGLVGLNYNSSSEGSYDHITFKNVTVDQTNKISALWGSYDVSCGGILGRLRENSKHDGTNTDGQKNTVTFDNCHVAAIMDVNNDCCANYQYYQYRYSGMLIGTLDYVGDVPAVGVADVVTATGCTVTYGDWNEYWYCELVKNTLASYTHDHQFSRLTEISSIDEIKRGDTWIKEGNFVLPNADNTAAKCYHIFKDSSGALYQHFHNVADESNPDIYETKDINGDGVLNDLKEDRQRYYIPFGQLWTGYGWGSSPTYEFEGITVANGGTVMSEPKFTAKNVETITQDTTVKLSDLVALAVDETKLSKSTLAVFVSPVGNESTVTANITINTGSWGESTLTFSGKGAAKIVITDYFYCTPTTIYVTVGEEQVPVDKFTSSDTTVFSKTTVTLGEIFAEIENPEVAVDDATVTVSAVDAEGNSVADVEYDTTTWKNGTLTFNGYTGDVTVTIKDGNRCNAFITSITLKNTVKFDNLFTGKFLYRVGNSNKVPVNYLFGENPENEANGVSISDSDVQVTIEKLESDTNVSGVFNSSTTGSWEGSSLSFTGTGPVKVTIQDNDYCEPTVLYLEVVNGYNVTTYDELKSNANSILLNNITLTADNCNISNCTLFGNGFTFDITNGAHNSGTNTNYSIIGLRSANLDNVQIKGAVYQNYGIMANSDYSAAAVGTSGVCKITNSYITNCLSPVKGLSGTLTLENTTLHGGRFCNLDIRGCTVVLDGVTTINTSAGGTKVPEGNVLGLGIVVYYQNSDGASITIKDGGLTQHNWLYIEGTDTKTGDYQYFNADGLTSAFDMMFKVNAKYTVGSKTYVNTGIVSLNTTVDENVITVPSNYTSKESVSYSGKDGYLWTPNAYIADDLDYENYVPTTQGAFEPTFKWNHPDGEYAVDGNKIAISFNEGESYTFDTTKPTATKSGQTLDITVKKDGVACGETATFTESGEYVFTYEYTDPYVYNVDGTKAEPKSYTKTLYVTTSAIKVATPAPTFTFVTQSGTNGGAYAGTYSGQAGTKDGDINGQIKTIVKDGQLWIMPNVSEADTTAFGSKSTNGMKGSIGVIDGIYFPIITGDIDVTKGTSVSNGTIKKHYPFFGIGGNSGSITIVDNGTTYSNSSPKAGPVFYSEYDGTQGIGVGSADDFGLKQGVTSTGASCTKCKWGLTSGAVSGGDASKDPADYGNNVPSIYYAKFSYTAANEQTYYYYVGFAFAQDTSAAKQKGCFTADTLITLADGSQKRVDEVQSSDKILAWDFFTGTYVEKNISLLVNHGEGSFDVANLEFSDGTTLRLIADHGVFDYDLNKFIYINVDNMNDYVGHRFVQYNADGSYNIVTLDNAYKTEEFTTAYSITSAGTSNAFASGMLTVAPPEDFYNWIEMDGKLHYDVEQFNNDVEQYGLYTYEDFADYVTYEQFVDWNGAYLKIPVEKGYFTFEYILELIELYKGWMPNN